MSAALIRTSVPAATTGAPSSVPVPQTPPDRSGSVAPGLCGNLCVELEADGPVLWLRGEVDAAVVADFERRWAASPPPLVAIDAGEATFVDSSAVALLLRWGRAASVLGSTAVLRRSSPRLDRVLDLMGLSSVFTRPYPRWTRGRTVRDTGAHPTNE